MRIGVVAASKFPPAQLSEVLSEGLRSSPVDAQWVVRKANVGAEKLLPEILPNPEVLTLDPAFKYEYVKGGVLRKVDDRAVVRDYEIILGCDRVVVFHLANSTTQRFANVAYLHPHIRIVEAE